MTTPRDIDLQNEVWKALNPLKCYAVTPGAIAELLELHPSAVTSALRSMFSWGIVNKVSRSVPTGSVRMIHGRFQRARVKRNHFWRTGVLECGQ